jgi:hypothetical protein
MLTMTLMLNTAGAEPTLPQLANNPFKRPASAALERQAQEAAAAPAWKPTLRALVAAGNSSLANVDGTIVALGEKIEGYRLVQVSEHEVVFQRGPERLVVAMPIIRHTTVEQPVSGDVHVTNSAETDPEAATVGTEPKSSDHDQHARGSNR